MLLFKATRKSIYLFIYLTLLSGIYIYTFGKHFYPTQLKCALITDFCLFNALQHNTILIIFREFSNLRLLIKDFSSNKWFLAFLRWILSGYLMTTAIYNRYTLTLWLIYTNYSTDWLHKLLRLISLTSQSSHFFLQDCTFFEVNYKKM